MKEHASKLPVEQPAKMLKSLLKKPGQTKSRSHKNRVVINEKLNEFFAADYIILIKEECCTDYEEDCDCCCQEHELIRLGNCKECRAELNLHFGVPDNDRYDEVERNDLICQNPARGRGCGDDGFGCMELRVDDEEDETEGEDEEDEEEEEGRRRNQDAVAAAAAAAAAMDEEKFSCRSLEESQVDEKSRMIERKSSVVPPTTQPPPPPPPPPPPTTESSLPQSPGPRQEHQETLSPPEGYKDVCSDAEVANTTEHLPLSFDYYRHQRTTDTKVRSNEAAEESRYGQTPRERDDESARRRNEQTRRQTPTELHHRYLVETITMTTVTERRIVREISEEERAAGRQVDTDTKSERNNGNWEDFERDVATSYVDEHCNNGHEDSIAPARRKFTDECGAQHNLSKLCSTEKDEEDGRPNRNDTPDMKDLSLVFKLGNSSLATNSLKPNSAVRQLFPNPKFVSPPPAPLTKSLSSASSLDQEGQKFLVTAESLRLFDAVRRSNSESQSDDETSLIKRTIERNTLRRSLIGKYQTSSRKKNPPPKNLSLEERIRQLTCVDQEEEDGRSKSAEIAETIAGSEIDAELLIRTSPSGEEEPSIKSLMDSSTTMAESTLVKMPMTSTNIIGFEMASAIMSTATMTSTTTTTTTKNAALISTNSMMMTETIAASNYHNKQNSTVSMPMDGSHNQSTYRKLTDLFVHKKNLPPNMPDLGLGGKSNSLGKEYQLKSVLSKTNNSDVRKQFLASLAPLSCVTVSSADNQEEYYRHSPRIALDGNRDSLTYNPDAPYSLEDIEAVLRDDERGYIGPPDVTRGTPTIASRPDIGDNTADELLAFVEQDKCRTERIKRRYDVDERYVPINGYSIDDRIADGENDKSARETGNREEAPANHDVVDGSDAARNNDNGDNDDDDDDELNDYGFNRRPSVRGIKQQLLENAEGLLRRQSSSAANNNPNDARTNFHPSTAPVYYERNGEKIDANVAKMYDETDNDSATNSYISPLVTDDRDASTINRINTMQKQIDDIYQTIAESTNVNTKNPMEESYSDDSFPRHYVRLPVNDPSFRFYPEQRNGHQYFQEQQNVSNVRMLRGVAAGAEEGTGVGYPGTLPSKARRREPMATFPNYPSNVQPAANTGVAGKCYRTMYFVPYNGLSDPTYQNIQRILPPHSSPNYANHIERYPYPRPGKEPVQQLQQPQLHLQPPQSRYYHPGHSMPSISNPTQTGPTSTLPPAAVDPAAPRLASITPLNSLQLQNTQQTLHLHLHHHQPPEDFRINGVAFSPMPHTAGHSLQLHHHQHHRHQEQYRVQSTLPATAAAPSPSSSYAVIAPTRCASYAGNGAAGAQNSYHLYQVQLGRTVFTPATEEQTSTTCSASALPSSASSSSSSSSAAAAMTQKPVSVLPSQVSEAIHVANFDSIGGAIQPILNHVPSSSSTSSSSSSSSITSSSSCSSSAPVTTALPIPSSPTKLQQQRVIGSYAVAERGVPEGAASAPSHDISQTGILLASNSYISHNPGGVSLPNHTQNSVYYAMNV